MTVSRLLPHPLLYKTTAILTFLPIFFLVTMSHCVASPSARTIGKRLAEQINNQKENIETSKAQQLDLVHELQRLDNELKVGQAKLTYLQERLLRLESSIEEKEQEIQRIRADKDTLAVHIKNRLRAFYQMDDVSMINTLFSASSLPELINMKNYFQTMFHYDKQVLQAFSTKINLLASAQSEIITEKDLLLAVILEHKQQEESLINSRLERERLLTKIQTEEDLYKRAIDQLNAAALSLAQKIQALNSKKVLRSAKRKITKLASSAKQAPAPKTFADSLGKLPPPAPGKVITFFGTRTEKFKTSRQSSGISIETAPTAGVSAIFPGTVVYTGPMEGFGNMIIIDHDNLYHSLVSGLTSISVEKGEKVESGQIIGAMGNNTTLLSQGLHLEIRHRSLALDPLEWLDKTTLTF